MIESSAVPSAEAFERSCPSSHLGNHVRWPGCAAGCLRVSLHVVLSTGSLEEGSVLELVAPGFPVPFVRPAEGASAVVDALGNLLGALAGVEQVAFDEEGGSLAASDGVDAPAIWVMVVHHMTKSESAPERNQVEE
jgi:hypothetical protein